MTLRKPFFFKVRGRIYGEDEEDVTQQIHDLIDGHTEFIIESIDEDTEVQEE